MARYRIVALASDDLGDTFTMSTHVQSSTGHTHVQAFFGGQYGGRRLQRSPLAKKSRTYASHGASVWQAHFSEHLSLPRQLGSVEREGGGDSVAKPTLYVTRAEQTHATAKTTAPASNDDPSSEGSGHHSSRTNQKSDGRKPVEIGESAPRCGSGKVRLDNACVSIPAQDQYDYIIVGCGAVGCPLAKTLADGGYRVLVLERGPRRSYENTPTAMDIFGAGKAVSDTSVAQLVHTNQGVRTQTAGIMGGGTSINMGIVTMETRVYFENLRKQFGWRFDFNRLEKAFRWVSRVFHRMPQDAEYSSRLRSSLQHHGYRAFHTPRASSLGQKNVRATDHSPFLHDGYVWGGATLFDSERKFFRDAADIFLYSNGLQNHTVQTGELVVKDRRYVERVLFESNNSLTLEAACVLHRSTRKQDMAPIGLRHNEKPAARMEAPARSFIKHLFRHVGNLLTSILGIQPRRQLSCIRRNGEIFLSAGAVHTPLLLFRSGIGPKEQLAELGIEPVAVNAHVGQHLTDRVLVPILLFANESKPRSTREPRVCQVLGMKRVGPACKGAGINQRTLKCSLIATEELSGPNIVHGLLWASHMLFPPSWRDNPALSAALEFAQLCEMNLALKGTPHYPAACLLLEEYTDCLDRSFALFYFTTEPKSRGFIRQHKNGSVEVEANYLRDEQDLFDAVRGTQALIQLVNGGKFDDVAQRLHADSCPVMMLRTLVDLFLRFAQATDLEKYKEQLLSVRRHAADLRPSTADAAITGPTLSPADVSSVKSTPSHLNTEAFTISSSGVLGLDSPKGGRTAVKGMTDDTGATAGITPNAHSYETALREVFKDREALEKILQTSSPRALSPEVSTLNFDSSATETQIPYWAQAAYDTQSCVDMRPCEESVAHTKTYTTTCLAHDVFSKRFQLPVCPARKTEEQTNQPGTVVSTEEWLLGLIKRGISQFFTADLPPGSHQTLATYPPILPRAEDPEEVAAFALTYMTSIWHMGGTAAMGLVVDKHFRVKGVKGLSIGDSSLLNQMTRLNPTATLMTLGRHPLPSGCLLLVTRSLILLAPRDVYECNVSQPAVVQGQACPRKLRIRHSLLAALSHAWAT